MSLTSEMDPKTRAYGCSQYIVLAENTLPLNKLEARRGSSRTLLKNERTVGGAQPDCQGGAHTFRRREERRKGYICTRGSSAEGEFVRGGRLRVLKVLIACKKPDDSENVNVKRRMISGLVSVNLLG